MNNSSDNKFLKKGFECLVIMNPNRFEGSGTARSSNFGYNFCIILFRFLFCLC